ncbi:MAG TPA: 2Fe-2S iron-sulfur cluster-binding protein [Pyrinomonadaceae bacterium]|jgi:ferredoxin|nr:2Fe-2S iron-sulfur cluster-binding protein [Pyrinomonadaceae bacterium]
MSSKAETPLEIFLSGHDDESWRDAINELLPSIHEVDRTATQIWFYFFPVALLRAFEQAEDAAKLAHELQMQGEWLLKDQVDSSHTFLYGHRLWPETKRAVVRVAESSKPDDGRTLASVVREVARAVAAERKVDESLAAGIAAVALMTLQQVGLGEFKKTPGAVLIDRRHARRTPEEVLRERARDDSQGLFGFLRTADKRWTVVWDENDDERRFRALDDQELASGAATDKRPWHEVDSRCTVNEGPIPVQCRSASCGTCWVGVLGGAEKLSERDWRERKVVPLMGYIETDEARPLIRLSCQARAEGAVSIVIPPWNGYFGKYLKKRREQQSSEETGEAVLS